ncbi:MAG: hypothetical protein ACJ71S_06400 [Acidobacteriaceae bacterium]|jgi:hypothetical protein
MITRWLTRIMIGISCVATLGILGTLIDHFPRTFIGLGICALAAISYVELGSAAARRGY